MVRRLKSSFVKYVYLNLNLKRRMKLHLKVLFHILESLSNPMIFITNYLMNAIASILQKILFFTGGRNIKYHLNLIQALDPIWQWYLLNKVTIITNCILLLVKILVTILTFFENLMIFGSSIILLVLFSFFSKPKGKFNPHQVLIGANNSKLKQKLSYSNTSWRHSRFTTP